MAVEQRYGVEQSQVAEHVDDKNMSETHTWEVSEAIIRNRNKRLKLSWQDQYFFTEQMSLLLDAGVAIVPALMLLEKSAKRRRLKQFLQFLKEGVTKGSAISLILKQFPNTFNALYVAMIQIGEESGKLPAIFLYLAEMAEKQEASRKEIRKALLYPLIVLVVAVVILAFIMIAVVPTFESLYQSSGMELPVITRHVMSMSRFLASEKGVYLWVGMITILFLLRMIYRRKGRLRYRFDRVVLRIPIVGNLLQADFNAHFGAILSMMLASGVQLVPAIALFEKSIHNLYCKSVLQDMHERLVEGKSLSDSIESEQLFSDVAKTLMAVGEVSGRLDHVLNKSGQYHADIVDDRVSRLIALIDPLSLVFIGGIVGVILIALYLPMFSMGMAL